MAIDKQELLDHYRQAGAELDQAIEGLSDAELSDPSLDGWSVKDHLFHLALWQEARAAEVERISAGHESTFRMTPEQDEAYNELGFALRKDLGAAQARWELRRARERLLAAIEAATPRGLDPANYGEAGLRSTHEPQHAEWIRRWRRERQP